MTIKMLVAAAMLVSVSMPASANESREAAERLRGDAQRAENRGDTRSAREARDAANKAERSTPEGARQIERDYNRGTPEAKPSPKPAQ